MTWVKDGIAESSPAVAHSTAVVAVAVVTVTMHQGSRPPSLLVAWLRAPSVAWRPCSAPASAAKTAWIAEALVVGRNCSREVQLRPSANTELAAAAVAAAVVAV